VTSALDHADRQIGHHGKSCDRRLVELTEAVANRANRASSSLPARSAVIGARLWR
jgi:hypothetical protein